MSSIYVQKEMIMLKVFFTIVDLNYVSLYIHDYQAAVDFYKRVFGQADVVGPEGSLHGWKMGATHLTIFPGTAGTHPKSNPRNTEFAIQVAKPDEVDALYAALVEAGATAGWEPKDTEMYVPMRFCYVDDPFGVRIDVICPL